MSFSGSALLARSTSRKIRLATHAAIGSMPFEQFRRHVVVKSSGTSFFLDWSQTPVAQPYSSDNLLNIACIKTHLLSDAQAGENWIGEVYAAQQHDLVPKPTSRPVGKVLVVVQLGKETFRQSYATAQEAENEFRKRYEPAFDIEGLNEALKANKAGDHDALYLFLYQ